MRSQPSRVPNLQNSSPTSVTTRRNSWSALGDPLTTHPDMLLTLLTFSLAAGSAQYCDQPSEHANDKWVLMNSTTGDTEVVADSGLPELPTGTQSISYGVNHAALQGYNRTIVVSGPLSLSSSDRHPESICPPAHHHICRLQHLARLHHRSHVSGLHLCAQLLLLRQTHASVPGNLCRYRQLSEWLVRA